MGVIRVFTGTSAMHVSIDRKRLPCMLTGSQNCENIFHQLLGLRLGLSLIHSD